MALGYASFGLSAESSIREVDFNNFDYPFLRDMDTTIPTRLTWLPVKGPVIHAHDGRYRFPCDDSPCPLLTVDRTVFGDIAGIPNTVAFVVTTYHSGGSATWQYVYVVSFSSGVPRVVAWLETGSRADMGLSQVMADRGDLVAVVFDPDKSEGDCCSSGTISYRYRWHGSSFEQVGQPTFSDRQGTTKR